MASWKPTYATKSGRWSRLGRLLPHLILGLFLSGCATLYDPESSHEWRIDLVHTLQSNELASQTVFLNQTSISEFTLWASPAGPPSPEAKLTLTLFRLDPAPKYLLSLSQSLTDCREQKCVFTFPSRTDIPPGQYAFVIKADAPLHLWGNRLDSYPRGNFSLNNQASAADLGFSIKYRYTLRSFSSDFLGFIQRFHLIVPTLTLLFTPGFLLLRLIRFRFPRDHSLNLYLITSTSLALVALSMAWTTFLGLPWKEGLVRLLFYLSFFLVTLLSIRNWRIWLGSIHFVDLLLLLVFFLALVIRLLMSRNLVAPPWVDSVHHALITQMIAQNGSYPSSYEPFFPSTTTSYHSGFHANLALFTWLSALPLPLSMLVFGQILNALSIYSVYALTLAFYPNRYAALLSAALVAFFSPMPAYYTSWGRYTHLCGLLILPAPVYLFRKRLALGTPLGSIPTLSGLTLLSTLFAGLIIIHYRASYFAFLLLGLSALETLLHSLTKKDKVSLLRLIFTIALVGSLTFALSLPWLPEAWKTLLLPKLNAWNQPPPVAEALPLNLLTPALGIVVLGLAGFGLLLEITRRSHSGLTLALWALLCYGTIYLSYLLSRGVGFLNMTAVTISLYLPLAVLGGNGLSKILLWVHRLARLEKPRAFLFSLSACIGVFAFLGGRLLIPLLNPVTFLVRNDDLGAMEFIRSSTFPHQKFLIQPFLWGYGLYAGSDGGSWIPALAGRPTIPPPVIFALSANNAQVQKLNQISQKILEKPTDASAIAQIMRETGLQYLYLGARGGAISPWAISQSPHFRLVYHKGGVFIFELQSQRTHP